MESRCQLNILSRPLDSVFLLLTSKSEACLRLTSAFITLLIHCSCFSQDGLYNTRYSIACHNCFELRYAPNIEDVLDYTTTIELDIWDSRSWVGGYKAMDRDWYVKHSFYENGNNNCCGGSLKDCLYRISNWIRKNPNHNVLTVFIDKKENWSKLHERRRPYELDQLILSIFSRKQLYIPKDLKMGELSLRAAINKTGWQSMSNLKGKVIFVITDGTKFTKKNNVLNEYLNSLRDTQICFVAPVIEKSSEVLTPQGIQNENCNSIIFYNLYSLNADIAVEICNKGFVSRVWGAQETRESINILKSKKVNFIALYNYKL